MKRVDASSQQMAALVRGHDWSSTPLRSTDTWPEALKLLLSIMMGSHQPMFVVWGDDHRIIYNDGYADILASKHPVALGMPFFEVWHEIRADLEPIVGKAMAAVEHLLGSRPEEAIEQNLLDGRNRWIWRGV